jgi:NAD(P)-dependent dehydrogenase (short-subunit alcohol dehydrogenase family)
MRGLKDKKVLVTGGASGIGQATAARFLEEQCDVCILDRSKTARARATQELPGCSTPKPSPNAPKKSGMRPSTPVSRAPI